MGYTTLKAALDAVVKTNGRQEITGANLNGVMTTILQGVDVLDRANPAETSGMTHVVLKRNKTFAEQVTMANAIYEIRDDFDLAGGSVAIPAGCLLMFRGGMLKNGTIQGNQTMIDSPEVQIFSSAIRKYRGYTLNDSFGIAEKSIGDDIEIVGTWRVDSVKKEWFGLSDDNSDRDCSHILANMIALQGGKIIKSLPVAVYGLYDIFTISENFDGNGCIFMPCAFDDIYDSSIPLPSGASALNSTNYPKGLRGQYGYVRCGNTMEDDITLENFSIDGKNIGVSDLPLVDWGIYGLYYSQYHPTTKVVLKDVVFKNSVQCCCFPTIQGTDVFENCIFTSCGEHCVYTRQSVGELILKNCVFESWGNISGYSNANNKDCHAVKYQSVVARETDIPITIDGCKFLKGNGLSAYVVNIFTDIVKIYNSEFEISYGFLSNNKDNANSFVDIRNCKYPPCNNRTINASLPISKIEIRDSICSSMNCIDAVLFENCTIDKILYTPTADARKFGLPSLLSDIKKCKFLNCRINVSCDNSSYRFLVYGTTEILFQNTEFYVGDESKPVCGFNFSKLENDSCVVTFDHCYCNKGKQTIGIQASTCDFILNNSIFRGSKSVPSGYVNRAPIFNSAKSIKINNSYCEADPTGFIAPLYINTITDVTYIPLTLGTSSDYYGSFKGQMKYDGTLNKYVFWNGTAWVNMDGSPLS